MSESLGKQTNLYCCPSNRILSTSCTLDGLAKNSIKLIDVPCCSSVS